MQWSADKPSIRRYRERRSTTNSPLGFLNLLAMNVINRTLVDIVHADFESAVKKMPHDLLPPVLSLEGVGLKIERWISAFLTGGSFRVKTDDAVSPRLCAEGLPTRHRPWQSIVSPLSTRWNMDWRAELNPI